MPATVTKTDEKVSKSPEEIAKEKAEMKRWWLAALVFALGVACAVPFGVGIWRLLDVTGGWLSLGLYGIGLRAGLAVLFAGVVLCILLLFYRMRNDDTSPSLTSGLLVVALGAAMTVLVLLAARGQTPTPAGAAKTLAPAR